MSIVLTEKQREQAEECIIFCEFHDDMAEFSVENKQYQFYQVKTKEDTADWTVVELSKREKRKTGEYKKSVLGFIKKFNYLPAICLSSAGPRPGTASDLYSLPLLNNPYSPKEGTSPLMHPALPFIDAGDCTTNAFGSTKHLLHPPTTSPQTPPRPSPSIYKRQGHPLHPKKVPPLP